MRPNKPFADIISVHLKPYGFERAGNHWRTSTNDTHIALELEHCSISRELCLHVGAWIRRVEEVPLRSVRPDSLSIHIKTQLRYLLPRLEYHYFRAGLHSIMPEDYDNTLSAQHISHAMDGACDDEKWMVEKAYIKNPPIGLKAKAKLFESAVTDHLIPFLKRLETEAAILECCKSDYFNLYMNDEAARFLGVSIHDQSDTFAIFTKELDAEKHIELVRARLGE